MKQEKQASLRLAQSAPRSPRLQSWVVHIFLLGRKHTSIQFAAFLNECTQKQKIVVTGINIRERLEYLFNAITAPYEYFVFSDMHDQ